MTAESLIDYEALAQEAMRNVVRSVLIETAAKGLPGEHHFYISFDTLAPGVILSKRLREKYAEEMTIVLQHRFWDLIVDDTRFEVKLTFDGIPERLVIPFQAIRVFFDPSVRYGLQFEGIQSAAAARHDADIDGIDVATFDDPFAARKPDRSTPTAVPAKRDGFGNKELAGTALPSKRSSGASDDDTTDQDNSDADLTEAHEDEAEAANSGAEIVSLDAFRKK